MMNPSSTKPVQAGRSMLYEDGQQAVELPVAGAELLLGGSSHASASLSPTPVLLSSDPVGTAAHTTITLTFNAPMAAGSGAIYVTDGVAQTVIDRVTGLPTMRIVRATDTHPISLSSLHIDGNHVEIEVTGLMAGHSYSVFMTPGALVTTTHQTFAGIRTADVVHFDAVDHTPPSVLGAKVTTHAGSYGATKLIEIRVAFDEAIRLVTDAIPSLVLNNHATATFARLDDGTNELVFHYTVAPGQDIAELAIDDYSSLIGNVADLAGNVLDAAHIGVPVLGNDTSSAPGSGIRIDTIAPNAPAVPMLDPGSDSGIAADRITNDSTPTFMGSGGELHATIELYEGATLLGTALVNDVGDWSVTPITALTTGPHTLTAKQVDQAGNRSTASAGIVVTIDTTAPVALAAAPALQLGSDSGRFSTDHVTNVTTPTFIGSGAEAGATIELYDGTARVGTAVADTSGAWSLTSNTLAPGVHTLTAKQVDVAGNRSAASPEVQVTIDTAAGALAAPVLVAASDSGTLSTDRITNVTTPTFTGSGAEAGATIELYDGSTQVGTAEANTDGNWTLISTVVLADGAHTLTVKQVDLAGNRSPGSAPIVVTVDTAAPGALAAPVLDPASDSGDSSIDRITSDNTPTLTGSGAEAGATIKMYDGSTLVGTATAESNGSWSLTTTTMLADGIHALTAAQVDAADNESTASASVAVTIDQSAPAALAAPALAAASDTGVSQSDGITADYTPTFTGTGAEPNAEIKLYADGARVGDVHADGSGAWSFTFAGGLVDGTHLITAVQEDKAGNESAASAATSITIDTSAPAVASYTATVPVAGTFVLKFSEKIDLGSIGNVTIYDALNVVYTILRPADGAWTVQTDGSHEYSEFHLSNLLTAGTYHLHVDHPSPADLVGIAMASPMADIFFTVALVPPLPS